LTVVDSTRAKMLHETALMARWYFPKDDVLADVLEPSGTTTHCPFKGDARYWRPFKGDARYWHLRTGERLVEDAFWEYPEPLPGAQWLEGPLSPYTEKFDWSIDAGGST